MVRMDEGFLQIPWSERFRGGAKDFEDCMTDHIHLDPVRERPPENISLGSLPENPKWEPWRKLLLDNMESGHLREKVSRELERLNVGYAVVTRKRKTTVYQPRSNSEANSTNDFPVEFESDDYELAFKDLQSNVTVSQHDIGYGISTIVPMLVAFSGFNGKIVSTEQPELHIHPRLQTELGDLILQSTFGPSELEKPCGPISVELDLSGNTIDYISDQASSFQGNQLFIETHSEHLILRILRRIRETTENELDGWPEDLRLAHPEGIRPEDVAVLYVEPGKEGSEVIRIPVTEDGDFAQPWPSGFFTERARELF